MRIPLLVARSFGVLALAGGATALAGDIHGYATAASDYVFRGVSQSNQEPSLQAGLDYEHAKGFFAGLFAAGIDYPESRFRADPGKVEVDAYLGYRRPAGRDFSWDVALFHYQYPDSEASDSNYQELGFDVYYRDLLRFGATFSDDARADGSRAWTAELELRQPFARYFEFSGTLGRYTFGGIWDDYEYFDAGVSATKGPWTFDVRYFGTSVEAKNFAGRRLADDRVVVSVSVGF